MSIKLHARGVLAGTLTRPILGRILATPSADLDPADHVWLTSDLAAASGVGAFGAIATTERLTSEALEPWLRAGVPVVHSLDAADHLAPGDIVRLNEFGRLSTLYRGGSEHNSILLTEACNSYCLMCSQPPRLVEPRALVAEHLRLIELIDVPPATLGFTGGEPTLLGSDLLRLIRRCSERLPETKLHILTNGRLFYYESLAHDLAAINHPNLVLGIPLYSDVDFEHDFVVQASGAFDQTLIGLHNLGRWQVPIELRVVIHRLTYARLPQLADFICRNLPFVEQVSLMGLEPMGFAAGHLERLWMDPHDYRAELLEATAVLVNFGVGVAIFNHQLCVTPRELWPFCVKSISDWKNEYLPLCDGCAVRTDCGGFFSSSLRRRHSARIAPIVGPPQ